MDVMKILIYVLIGLEAVVALFIGIAVIKESKKEKNGVKVKETDSTEPLVQESPAVEKTSAIEEKIEPQTLAIQSDVKCEPKPMVCEDRPLSEPREHKRRRLRIVRSKSPVENENVTCNNCNLDEKLVRITRG